MLKESNNKPKPLSSQPKRSWGEEEEEDTSNSSTTTTNFKKVKSIEFELNEEDWPPSPPKKVVKKSDLSTKSTNSTSTSNSNWTTARPPPNYINSTSNSSTTTGGKPLAAKPSFTGKSMSNSTGLASIFKPPMKVSTSSTSMNNNNNNNNSNKNRSTSTSSTSNSNSSSSSSSSTIKKSSSSSSTASTFKVPGMISTSTTTAAAGPKRRAMPWELPSNTGASSSSSSSLVRPSANFHTLPSNTASGSGSSSNSKGIKRDMLTSNSMSIAQKVSLSPEQQMVLKLVVNDGKNVFFTGSAGTGKSVLLREIITALKAKHKSADFVAVTASTGMAACNIRGTTIHSFAGIGIGAEDADSLITKVRKNRIAAGRWSRVKVLIMDEVSMVDGILFDKLAAIGKALKKNNLPFGGIQLIITGDFFQLPPVVKGATTVFAFEAKAWSQVIHHTVNLTQVFRQKDTTFIDMLNEMRFGTLSAASCDKFAKLSRDPEYTDGVEPTELFPRREEVERANNKRLASLSGEMQIFIANDFDKYKFDGKPSATINSFMAVEKLELKVGAQVMAIKNIDADLVNGSVGKVIGFGYDHDDDNDDDSFAVKGEDGFEPDRKKLKLAMAVGTGKAEMAPRVEFKLHNGDMRTVTMKREDWSVEDSSRVITASRNQYPLILAWAMSIHKSQGQTIPRVKVDLGKVFEKGQSYVALSRAVSLDGLQVLGFNKTKVSAHPKVIAWSKTLETLN